MTKTLNLTHARQVIINGVFPQQVVKIFGIPFNFTFCDTPFPAAYRDQLHFIENVVSSRKHTGDQFIRELPPIFYREILRMYALYCERVGLELFEVTAEYFETGESRNYWDVFKNTSPDLAITIKTGKLNSFQRRWILINSQKDKKDMGDLITQVFDLLKPWLNSELYQHLKEYEDVRENVAFDEERLEEVDAKLREKAAAAFKTQQMQQEAENDLDEIEIDGE